jgi:hypothetical protein
MIIRNNRLFNCGRGLWLDWMAQGTRVTRNLFYLNTTDDIFVEVNHGPYLIDNNILLSATAVRDWSEGGAFVHNLFAGNIEIRPQERFTPFHQPHSAELAGLKQTRCGDNRFYNNIFMGGMQGEGNTISGLSAYHSTELPVFANGNIYYNGIEIFKTEKNFLELTNKAKLEMKEDKSALIFDFDLDKTINRLKTNLITTDFLGKAVVPGQGYENPDGTPITIDSDYFGNKRSKKNPVPGPFEIPEEGKMELLMR